MLRFISRYKFKHQWHVSVRGFGQVNVMIRIHEKCVFQMNRYVAKTRSATFFSKQRKALEQYLDESSLGFNDKEELEKVVQFLSTDCFPISHPKVGIKFLLPIGTG